MNKLIGRQVSLDRKTLPVEKAEPRDASEDAVPPTSKADWLDEFYLDIGGSE